MSLSDPPTASHPYQDLPASAFWRSVMAGHDGEDFSQLFQPKFNFTAQDAVATAGSCFAQHLGRALQEAGCTVLDGEPAPVTLPPQQRAAFGYGIYAARYGNIYTPRQLLDLLMQLRTANPAVLAWQKQGRWYDALRQNVEPAGLEDASEVAVHRAYHLAALRRVLAQTQVFVFTLGMTEAWQDIETGLTLPVCPGVIAGQYSPDTTRFVNFRYPQISADLAAIRSELHRYNPSMRLLLTVSPVPLTATASGRHVLAATVSSKATLRAAAGDFAAEHDDTDYFPSYEIVTSPAARSAWFEPNLRQVRPEAVQRVMAIFLAAYGLTRSADAPADNPAPPAITPDSESEGDTVICEDQLLQAFAR